MAKKIMIQGTMSGVGKSLLTAGLCRVLRQDGFRVAPFKSQNMSLNSYITDEGLEMGRAQVVQAEACGIAPSVYMNPILLKPVTNMGSQVIVNGEVRGNMQAADYFKYKKALIPDIIHAFDELSSRYDVIVIEGAGSPAEINLKKDDIVNMGLAKMLRSPVLLAGDIDRGGVFAQLIGTLMLLEEDERELVKATIVNKFRGDLEILRPGISMLEERSGKPVAGVLPYLQVDIEEEDSLTDRFSSQKRDAALDIVVIRLPKISNFTDFMAMEATEGVGLRYVEKSRDLGRPDMVILPGTKNTIADLIWLRSSGLEASIKRLAGEGVPVFGICGGYQILGDMIRDPENTEGGGEVAGMGLLPIKTEFHPEKNRLRCSGYVEAEGDVFASLHGVRVEGYEIHMGISRLKDGGVPLVIFSDGRKDGCIAGNIAGTYLHGFFDESCCRNAIFSALCERKGIPPLEENAFDLSKYKNEQFDLLAEAVRENLDMPFIYQLINESEG